jgi:hypothetical protein
MLYLVAGGFAVAFHGYPRNTKDSNAPTTNRMLQLDHNEQRIAYSSILSCDSACAEYIV